MKKILIVSALATACLAVMAKNDEKSLIQYVDVIVDGKYDKNLRDVTLLWKGSSNQRIQSASQWFI